MQPIQWQEHKFANPSHSNPSKATNAMERYERKNKKEIQDLHPLCSPHLEQRWVGENIDLDLLSLFPQRYARIMGGIKRGASFPRSNNGGEGEKEATSPRRKKEAFYRSSNEI
jgi:hypothetical protein